jgi:SAM-dependent methyltransferase
MKFTEELESFKTLEEDLPDCSHIFQGKVLLERLSKADSYRSRLILTLALHGISLPEQGRILEIGPGCCQYAIELCLRGYEYVGYDVVQQNLDLWPILKTHYQLKGDIQLQDICTIETEEQFDGIFSRSTFEHIHNQEQALQNCFSLLKPGGRLVIIDGNLLHPRLLWNMTFVRPDGGLKWLFTKGRVNENYGMGWKGKAEDVKTVYWWRRNIRRYGFFGSCFTTACFTRPWTKVIGLWPFLGSIVVYGQKPNK